MSTTSPDPNPSPSQAAPSSSSTANRPEAYHQPRPQPYYHHDGKSWIPSTKSVPSRLAVPEIDIKAITVLSWNIDMLVGFAVTRMGAALEHLSGYVAAAPPNAPLVIFLQEMDYSDLKQIRESRWIQTAFCITDLDEKTWLSSSYGTTMLVDRRLRIESVFRVPWASKYSRDGLFVDLALATQGKVLRLCNTHLESLVADPPVRPLQMQSAATYLHEKKAAASLLAGDLNAIQPFDRTLHSDNDLKDAYLELGGEEDSHEGYTWGYQVPEAVRGRFGPSRMDKILFAGALEPRTFDRFGVGVKAPEDKWQKLRKAGLGEWVTDHYGVLGTFELGEGCELPVNEPPGEPVLARLTCGLLGQNATSRPAGSSSPWRGKGS